MFSRKIKSQIQKTHWKTSELKITKKGNPMKLFSIFKTTIFLSTTLLFTACGPANSTPTPTPKLIPAELITQWGGEGSGDGQFQSEVDIATGSYDNIYTIDTYNYRIQKFDSNGTFLLKWGSEGEFEGQFNKPRSIAIDSHNNMYVLDSGNYRIQKFDSNGTFLLGWGYKGSTDGGFDTSLGIAIDSHDNIYVTDTKNNRIQKFDSNGTFMLQWGRYGSGEGQFKTPSDITVDSQDNVYVVDRYNYRIQKFDSNGTFLLQWGSQLVWGEKDSNNMKFEAPCDIHVDNLGNVYVIDRTRAIIKKFDTNGNFLSSWNGSTDGRRFVSPAGIATDSSGNVYVMDDYYIWKFKP